MGRMNRDGELVRRSSWRGGESQMKHWRTSARVVKREGVCPRTEQCQKRDGEGDEADDDGGVADWRQCRHDSNFWERARRSSLPGLV